MRSRFAIGSRLETALFWGVMLAFVVGVFSSPFLPFTDYPAHLGLAGTLSRIWSGDPAARALYDTNIISYNSLFHVVVALFALVVRIETAGRLAVCLYFVGLPLVVLALLRAFGRPPWRVFVVTTFLVGFPVTWGFFNYCFGLTLGLLVAVRVLRDERPTLGSMAITTALISLDAFAHLFAMLVCATLLGAALLGRALAEPSGFVRRALAGARSLLPFVPALGVCAWIYFRQEKGPVVYDEFAYLNGHDVPARYKVVDFFSTALRARDDLFDVRVCQVALATLLLSIPFRAIRGSSRSASAAAWSMFAAALGFYFFLPDTLWSTAKVFERITILVLVTGVVAMPRANALVSRLERFLLPACALAAAGLFVQIRFSQHRTYADLDRILDDAPKNRRLLSLLRSVDLDGWTGNALGHAGSYYVARNGGESAVHFAKYMSLPVHYRPERRPPAAPDQLAWNGAASYDPNAAYARYFDLVLWRAWDDEPDEDPRPLVWGGAGERIEVVSHRGVWWLLDTKNLAAVAAAEAPALAPAVASSSTLTSASAPAAAWCEPGFETLDEETCYVPPDRDAGPLRLLVYLHGIVPPLPHSEQKTHVAKVILASCRRSGAAAVMPRGVRGIGPEGAKDWWAWPTSPDAHARESKAIVAKWVKTKASLEARFGATFARTYLAGSSNGAYFIAALALQAELTALGFPVDGYGAMSGGATGGRVVSSSSPTPFYVGWGAADDTRDGPKALAAALEQAKWPTRKAEHPFGHGAREVYLDEAFAFWDSL